MMLVTTGGEHAVHVVGLESVAEEHADVHHSSSSIMANMCAPNGSGETTLPPSFPLSVLSHCILDKAIVFSGVRSVTLRSGRGDSF
eukprot:scaffold73910_cov37-Attheya_sp.AAC.4